MDAISVKLSHYCLKLLFSVGIAQANIKGGNGYRRQINLFSYEMNKELFALIALKGTASSESNLRSQWGAGSSWCSRT